MAFLAVFSTLLVFSVFIAAHSFVPKIKRWHLRRTAYVRHGCQHPPSYPHKNPYGFDLMELSKEAYQAHRYLDFTGALFARYGKTYQIKQSGKTIIRTADPEVCKAIYATHFENFGLQPIRYEGGKGFFGNGILVTDGQRWKRSRALLRPAFDVAHVANFERLEKHVSRFLKLLPRDGSTVDLMPGLKRLTLDISTDFIFGKSMNALESPEACQDFLRAFTSAQRGVVTPEAARDKDFEQACKQILDFIDERVEEAFARSASGKANANSRERVRLIDELIKETQDRISLRYLVLSAFSPAHDTVAVTLTNTFFHLARNPTSWNKLRSEILPTSSRPLTYELLNSYRYLDWVLKETHRITPVAPASQRQCLTSTVLSTGSGLDGLSPLFIEAGTIVETNFRAMQRDKTYWGEDTEVFRPERWEAVRPGWRYIPFSGGPRICPAMKLVYTECGYVLVRMLREYARLECRDPIHEWVEERRLIYQSKNGALVGLVP
ncbi:cytochrome P450 [Lophiotrema nucula]|uniref:Cytochrome P450 n=1 Tax=Lophiotrema nucula TaxID=690887 RepID=A0A6A5YUK2_9PLEO|nr:cytochrome P450 [Lophiotrema nucula]